MNNKKRRKKKKILTKVLIVLAIVIVIAAVAIRILQNRVTSQFASSSADEVVSAEVTTGTISTTVSGSGTLAEEGAEELKVPAAITIDEIVVNDGDTVEEGDVIATADDASVVRAMSDLQTAIDELDAQLTDASAETASTTITTSVAGRVKKIYAAKDEDVATVMYDDGALALLSLDGYMSVEIETSDLTEGESVTVTTDAGVSYSGKVDTVQSKKATVLVSDNGPAEGESVSVKNAAGTTVGSGELHVHEALKITGYAGTVSAVNVSENASVSAGATLFTLTDTSYTADYDELLQQRETMEERLEELIVIYKDGSVKAPMAGTVRELTDTDSTSTTTTTSTSSTDTLTAQTTLVTICPDTTMSVEISVDESDILSLSTGQEVSLTIDSIDSNTTYTGTVEEIGTSGTSSSGVTTYPVTVTLDKTDEMRAGMSVSAAIQIESVENALMVPEEAVTQTRSKTYVYTSVDETTGELSGMQEVTTGISGNGYIEITDGLSEGDTVYYTESTTTFDFSMPGGMSDIGGDMDIDIGGGDSGGGGGQMPDGGGGGGGSMPDGGGGSMPGGGSSN